MDKVQKYEYVTIVVIGYNEGKNLDVTFKAIKNMNYPSNRIEVIYVDSGSNDNSVEIARKYANKVFIENSFPSAGRNRNRGLVEASHEIIHFIDGDVAIDKDYLRSAIPLFSQLKIHAIVGQLEEQNNSLYNRISALSNAEKKEGYTLFTSTGATYLKGALLSVNGYDERIRRGQESELGERFRNAGYKIWCSSYKMGAHNFGRTNLWQYVQKYKTNARSLVQISLIKGDSNYFKAARKKMIKQWLKITILLLSLLISVIFKEFLIFAIYLIISWLLRNRSLLPKIKKSPVLVLLSAMIDFFFSWLWWLGFLQEFFRYLFISSSKEFYGLEKMKL